MDRYRDEERKPYRTGASVPRHKHNSHNCLGGILRAPAKNLSRDRRDLLLGRRWQGLSGGGRLPRGGKANGLLLVRGSDARHDGAWRPRIATAAGARARIRF